MQKTIAILKKHQLTGHNASVFALSASASELYSAAGDGWIVRWNPADADLGRLVAKVETQLFSVLFLKNENKIVAGNMTGGLHWVDLDNPALSKNVAHHKKGVFGLLQIGDSLISAGGEGILTRWSVAECRTLESLHLSAKSLRCLDYSVVRNEIAVGSSDFSIYLLDAHTFEIKTILKTAHENSVFALRYSPDGNFLLSGGRDAHLKAWSPDSDTKLIFSQPAHWYTINDIVFHPSGQWFATASRDKTIKIWDGKTFELLKVIESFRDGGHVNSVNKLLFLDEADLLVSAGDDRSIILWKIKI